MRVFRGATLLIVVIACVAWRTAMAAQLSAELIPLAPRFRSDAPCPVDVQLTWNGGGVLEGELEISVSNGSGPLYRYRLGELALVAGRQTIRTLLPPAMDQYDPEIRAELRFVAKDHVIDLGKTPLAPAGVYGRSHLICVATHTGAAAGLQLFRALRLEPFDPKSNYLRATENPVQVPAEDLPLSPLAYCAYDLVVIDADSFSAMREKQLDRLAAWTEGGGSVCVTPKGTLGREHVDFLNRLAGKRAPLYSLDSAGHLSGVKGIENFRSGLGRVIVTADELTEKSEHARDAALFLWKVSYAQRAAILLQNQWKEDSTSAQSSRYPGNDPQSFFVAALLPRTRRAIPVSVIIGVLALFVVAVGPADYIVLGWFKQRRLTWIVFPVVCGVFTLSTVALAEHYLGTNDFRGSIIINDVGDNGRIFRQSRLLLMFAGRSKSIGSAFQNAIVAPVERAGTGRSHVLYEGAFPSHVTLSQTVRQWTPQFTRTLSFGGGDAPAEIDWRPIDAELRHENKSAPSGSKPALAPPGYSVCFLQYGSVSGISHPLPPNVISQISAASGKEPLAVSSQLSPSGSGALDDLPLLDPTDPEEALAVLVTRRWNDIILYRRLYHGDK